MSLFVTRETARLAVEHVLPTITAMMTAKTVRQANLHIVVGNPAYQQGHGITYETWAKSGGILYEHPLGERAEWKASYDQIARSKAYMSWRTGLTTRVIQFERPELIIPGDTGYYGSAIEPASRWAVGVSGVEPYFDEAFAQCVLAMGMALVYQKRELAMAGNQHFL